MAVRDDISDRARDRVGSTLKAKWTLDGVVGVGGMATVYAATHRNNSRVAIKMLHPEVSVDAEVTMRFLREGYVANTVDHPGTVQVFDDDVSEDGAAFLVMELLEGETLEARWERKGHRLPVSEVLPIVDQLLDVLASAHTRGVIHRDLKPENLFLTKDGRLKVLDFGIARLRELSKHSGATTKVGSLLGTPAFMAPEQALGRLEEVDPRTDLWAVGATLFTLLAGRYVHEADTVNEQLILAATVDAPSVAQFCPHLPVPVVRLVDRALSFKKVDRWADARAMQGGLREAQESLDLSGPLSLPRPSVIGGAPPTLAAPSVSSLLEVESVPALTTTSPPAPLEFEPPVTPRRRAGLVVGIVAAVCVFIAVASFGLRTDVSAEQPEQGLEGSTAAEPVRTSFSPPVAEPSNPDPAEPTAGTPAVDPPEPHAKTPPKPEKPVPVRGPRTGPLPKPAPAPVSAKPPSTAKPPDTPQPPATAKPQPPAGDPNPFDRRH